MSLTEQLADELGISVDELKHRLGVISVHYAQPSEAKPNPDHQRVAALQRRAVQMRAAGLWDDFTPSHATMLADDTESNLERAGRVRDGYHAAERNGQVGFGARFTPTKHPEG